MNIYEKLQKCRVELQKTELKKSGKNKFSGFDYFELKDFMPTVNELFDKYKLFSNFSITNEGVAKLTIIDTEYLSNFKIVIDDKTGSSSIEPLCLMEELYKTEFTSPIEELELKGCNKVQALGGVHTYIKRYLYLNALEIVENDMFDPNAGSGQLEPVENPNSKPTSKLVNESKSKEEVFINMTQKNELRELIGSTEFASIMNKNSGKLTVAEFERIKSEVENGK